MRDPPLILIAELIWAVHARKSVRNSAGFSDVEFPRQFRHAVRSMIMSIDAEALRQSLTLILSGKIIASVALLKLHAVHVVSVNLVCRSIDHRCFCAVDQIKSSR